MTESTVDSDSGPAAEREVPAWQLFRVVPAAAVRLTPHLVRVTFRSADRQWDQLIHFADNGFDQRIKLILPAPGSDLTMLPTGDNWHTRLRQLPERIRPAVRTYTVRTVRRGDADRPSEVDVDMVLHGVNGPASAWLVRLLEFPDRAADFEVALLGPDARHAGPHGGLEFVSGVRSDLLFVADETALPAVAAILERLPAAATGTALLEVPTAADAVELAAPQGIRIRWLPRDDDANGDAMVAAALGWAPGTLTTGTALGTGTAADKVADPDDWEELLWEVPDIPETERFRPGTPESGAPQGIRAWVAGEAAAVRTIRRHLVGPCGLDRRDVAFMGYWRLGRAEG